MLPTLSEQTVYFFASVVFGAALSALYGLVRLIRVLVDRNFFDVISDILFFIAAGVLTSLFALPFNKGDVRGFIVLGEAIGFLRMSKAEALITSNSRGSSVLPTFGLAPLSSRICTIWGELLLTANCSRVFFCRS